jgi:hypothetical protein
MMVLNISEEFMDGIFSLVSAVLHIGNLKVGLFAGVFPPSPRLSSARQARTSVTISPRSSETLMASLWR